MPVKISIRGAVPLPDGRRFAQSVDWALGPGEQWAVVGPNGAGKSMLAGILQGRTALLRGSVGVADAATGRALQPWDAIRAMEFRDIYSLVDCGEVYYQQRWNSTDAERVPLAGQLLAGAGGAEEHAGSDAWGPAAERGGFDPSGPAAQMAAKFSLGGLLDKPIIALSSGELRKLLITRTLMAMPRVLVLDNPFIGLDAASRDQLGQMMEALCGGGMQLVLLLSNPADIPPWITHVRPVKDKTLPPVCTREAFFADAELLDSLFPQEDGPVELPATAAQSSCGTAASPGDYRMAIRMEGVTVRYGGRTILDRVDWQVARGEKWALLGPNGSGKSTLLSLVTGDNPQAYANRVTLFDRRRGTGESIWDIKRRIGMLNPDLHTYYIKDIPAEEVVASGFFDSIGLYHHPTGDQLRTSREWLAALGGARLAGRSFVRLSPGEQRLALLARAMVKDPEVLILDEPLHGLDASRRRRAGALVDAFCRRPGKTLIYVTHFPEEIPPCVTRIKRLQ